MWDPQQYLKFSQERARPFFDLLSQVKRESVRNGVDLGCGPGELTHLLAERWSRPAARFVGVDNSPEMLEKARVLTILGRLTFELGDIATWKSDVPLDLIVSNAALHWVPDHARLLLELADMLAPDGTIAVQMPSRFQTPAQQAIDETVRQPRWSVLQDVGLRPDCVKPIAWYVERLHDLAFEVNAWETTYVHVLSGADPVLEWLKGTALRPLLVRLDAEAKDEFLRELGGRLRIAYPPAGEHTLFPFPRIFFVATRR
jgi:trans-aconitate 2-methyltransferase